MHDLVRCAMSWLYQRERFAEVASRVERRTRRGPPLMTRKTHPDVAKVAEWVWPMKGSKKPTRMRIMSSC